MKKPFNRKLLSLLWLMAAVLPLAACGNKPAPEPAAAATAPEPADKLSAPPVPAYAIITVPVAGDPAVITPVVASATDANVLVLEKLPKQIAETGIKSPFFSTLAVVKFSSEEQLEHWYGPAAVALGNKASIKRADLVVADGVSATPRPEAYFAVNLYETLIPADQYKAYTSTYITPNMANQKNSGVMSSYAMYVERADGDSKPRSILLKEYASEKSFGESEAVKDAYKRDVLLKDAEWKRIDETKATIRTDLNETLARNAAQ